MGSTKAASSNLHLGWIWCFFLKFVIARTFNDTLILPQAKPPGHTSQDGSYSPSIKSYLNGAFLFYSPNLIWLTIALGESYTACLFCNLFMLIMLHCLDSNLFRVSVRLRGRKAGLEQKLDNAAWAHQCRGYFNICQLLAHHVVLLGVRHAAFQSRSRVPLE